MLMQVAHMETIHFVILPSDLEVPVTLLLLRTV
jgi:hypothetical protein